MTGWAPPARSGWPLESQIAAAGLEPPTVTATAYHFLRGRLVAHVCQRADCRECAESRRLGLRTLRISREEIAAGVALDKIGAALWAKPKGGLF